MKFLQAILLGVVCFSSGGVIAESDRLSAANELTEMANAVELKITFSVDANDDTTLVLNRETTLKPSELAGDWTMYLFSIGTSVNHLRDQGFNKVRIYTSQSEGVNDYVLKTL